MRAMFGRWVMAAVCGGLCVVLSGCAGERKHATPESLLKTGWDYYRLGEYSLALKDFQLAVAHAPTGSAVHLSALYGEATTWWLQRPDEDVERAAQRYRQVIELAPSNSLAAWSWLALARIQAQPVEGEAPDLKPLVQAYQEVIDRFPFHPAGEEAFVMQQAAKLSIPDKTLTREALDALEQFLTNHPQSPWRSEVNHLIAFSCGILGLEQRRLEAAIQSWKTAETDPNNPIQDLSVTYWRIATIAEFGVGDFATAREYYRKLIAEYPTEQRIFLAKQELKRMDELEARLRTEEQAP